LIAKQQTSIFQAIDKHSTSFLNGFGNSHCNEQVKTASAMLENAKNSPNNNNQLVAGVEGNGNGTGTNGDKQ